MAVVDVDAEQHGQSLSVAVGDTVVVRLTENPTTGHRWQVGDVKTAPGMELVDDRFEPAPTPTVGSGGVRVLSFRFGAAGTVALDLENRRAGQAAGSGVDRWRVEVTAR